MGNHPSTGIVRGVGIGSRGELESCTRDVERDSVL